MEVKDLARKYKQYAINLRREFHKIPEPSWKEIKTSARIKEELTKLNIPYEEVAGTGVVATIKGKKDGKVVALRADMDALEVTELTDVDYKSQHEGVMHACGHDNHMAMLLCAGRILSEMKESINGTVKLLFQPAEEVAEGAKALIKAGAIEGVDGVFGIHVWSDIEAGKVSVETGPRMASADLFEMKVVGKGGHGSAPHQGIDAVVAASAVVMNLQTVVSREFSPQEPVVVSVGTFNAGTRFNVIASEADLSGTTRSFNPAVRAELPNIIKRIAKNTANSFRCSADLAYNLGTPAVINDASCALIAQQAVERMYGKETLTTFEKISGAEDLSYYMEKVPGAIAFLGVRNEKKGASFAQHHAKYNVDEDALECGSALYAQFAVDFLNQ